MKKLLLIFSLFLLALATVWALFNTLSLFSKQKQIAAKPLTYQLDSAAVEKLCKAIRYETTAGKDSQQLGEFERFHTFLQQNFPNVHNSSGIKWINIDQTGLLYRWKGSNNSNKSNLWLAAQDVAEPDLKTIPQWRFNPFVGKHENGIIYGAGSNQHKFCLLAILQTWENAAKSGFQPKNDLYLFAPADFYQPISTQTKTAASLFYTQDLKFQYVLVAENFIQDENNPFAGKNIAYIGTHQKNTLNFELQTNDSSTLSDFYNQLNRKEAYLGVKEAGSQQLINYLAPEMSFGKRFLFANPGFFSYFIKRQLLNDSFLLNAAQIEVSIQTKTTNSAEIILQLPQNIDFNQYRQQWASDSSVYQISTVEKQIFANVASTSSWEWGLLERVIKETNPNTIIAPSPAWRGNSGGYFQLISPNVYYFSPVELSKDDFNRYAQHIDEHISVENYTKMVAFYSGLLQAN